MHREILAIILLGVGASALFPEPLRAQSATLDGTLTAVWVDPQSPAVSAPDPIWFLTADDGRLLDVRLSREVLNRAGGITAVDRRRVTVTGFQVAAAGAGGSSSLSTIEATALTVRGQAPGVAASLGAATISRPYAILLCKFSDIATETEAPSFFASLMGDAFPNLRHYYLEASTGQFDLAGTQVYGWFDLTKPRSHYVSGNANAMVNALTTDCAAAADPSVNFAQFSGIVMQFNGEFDGSAYGGSHFIALDGPMKLWPMVWMPAAATDVSRYAIYAHEIGHSLGLPHSSGPYGETYDSDWDVMSNAYLRYDDANGGWIGGHTIAVHKAALGWISGARSAFVTNTAQTITLEKSAFPSGGTNPLIGRVNIPGTSDYYTVEARKRIGYDEGLPGEAVIIHKVQAGMAFVVDPDGNGNPNDDGAMWLPGETFSDGKGIRVAVESATTDGWVVRMSPGNILKVRGAGTGNGQVVAAAGTVPPISCTITNGGTSGSCTAPYYDNPQVTLTATPNPGMTFVGWSGPCTGTGACVMTMTEDREPVANFVENAATTRSLTILANGSGSGTVTSSPAGITCVLHGVAPTGECVANFAASETITLTALPADGSVFGTWTGCLGGSTSCALQLADDSAVTVTFEVILGHTISTAASPAAGGTTTGGGLHDAGALVTVTALPNDGWNFVHWTEAGAPVSTSASYSFTASGAKELVAVFKRLPPPSLTTARVSGAVLGSSTLTSAEIEYLDQIGNNNGRLDTGDFLAWLATQ